MGEELGHHVHPHPLEQQVGGVRVAQRMQLNTIPVRACSRPTSLWTAW